MGRISNSWQLVKESWRILKKDKELLLFPVISAIISLAILAVVFIPAFFLFLAGSSIAPRIAIVVTTYLIYFTSVFFNAGVVYAANMCLHGKDPKFSDGIKGAMKNLHKLFMWSLIAATIGLLLRALSKRRGLESLISGIIGFAWELITFFIIPVILFEKKGTIESIKRSGELFKKTWGETIVGEFSIGLILALLIFGGIGLLIVLLLIAPILALIFFVPVLIFIVIVIVVGSVLSSIFKTALYIYATSKRVPKGFSPELVKNIYRKK